MNTPNVNGETPNRYIEFLTQATEGLNVEIKTWLNLGDASARSKVVKSLIALRNRNGGYLVIGLNNKTGLPDPCNIGDVRTHYHPDILQGLITKHAQYPFPVEVYFPELNGVHHPIIIVPNGVTIPVAVKSPIDGADGSPLLRYGEVPFRTLHSNNTVSSANALPKDWDEIVTICSDNREADVARFIRRHFGRNDQFDAVFKGEEAFRKWMDQCWDRFANKSSSAGGIPRGIFEVAVQVNPPLPPQAATQETLTRALSSNPNYRSWSIWLDTRQFADEAQRFRVIDRGFEAFVNVTTFWEHFEFYRIEAEGRFYAASRIIDDANAIARNVKTEITLDPLVAFIGVAEAILVALEMAKGLGASGAKCNLVFNFRWRGLRGRRLSSWSTNGIPFSRERTAIDDEVLTQVTVPLDTAIEAVEQYAHSAVIDLMAAFDGFEISAGFASNAMRRLLARQH